MEYPIFLSAKVRAREEENVEFELPKKLKMVSIYFHIRKEVPTVKSGPLTSGITARINNITLDVGTITRMPNRTLSFETDLKKGENVVELKNDSSYHVTLDIVIKARDT